MKKIIITLLSYTLSLCDCIQSNIIASEDNRVPDMEIRGGIEIEQGQVWDNLDVQFLDKELYLFNENINGSIMDEENKIGLILLVNEEITEEQTSECATIVLKGLNDSVAIQDFSLNPSDEEFYGGFVSNNDVSVLVAPVLLFKDSSTHILEDTIKIDGEYRPVGMPAAE